MQKFVPNSISIKSITAPASKSFAQRILLAAVLSREHTVVKGYGFSDDVIHIKNVIQQLGAEVIENENALEIIGQHHQPNTVLNCGESGLGIRLTTTIASTFNRAFEIIGEGSLLNRPLDQFAKFLPKMGVEVSFSNAGLPIKINGKLKSGNYTVDGGLSSQYISGLLMALPVVNGDSRLTVLNPKSTPYLDITLEVLRLFGITVEHQNYQTFFIEGNQKYLPKTNEIIVEGDWSGAAFWVVYGLIKGEIELLNLNENSTQADKAILKVVELVGSSFSWYNGILTVKKYELKPFEFDATHCPDLFPALVVLAAAIKGKSTILGVKRLAHKESDRGVVLKNEFNKLGLKIELTDDRMEVWGEGVLNSGTIDSNNDHRIAMAGAIAAILTPKGVTITNADSVNKSYPEFWKEIKKGNI